MSKPENHKIDANLANKILTSIINRVYPLLEIEEFDLYEYSEGCLFSYLRWHNTNIKEYINNNFYTGIMQLIKAIDGDMFIDKEVAIANHLLAALTYICYDQESKVKQEKYEVVYHLFVQKLKTLMPL